MKWNNNQDTTNGIKESHSTNELEQVTHNQSVRLNDLIEIIEETIEYDKNEGLYSSCFDMTELSSSLSNSIDKSSQFIVNYLDNRFGSDSELMKLLHLVSKTGDSTILLCLYNLIMDAEAYDRIK